MKLNLFIIPLLLLFILTVQVTHSQTTTCDNAGALASWGTNDCGTISISPSSITGTGTATINNQVNIGSGGPNDFTVRTLYVPQSVGCPAGANSIFWASVPDCSVLGQSGNPNNECTNIIYQAACNNPCGNTFISPSGDTSASPAGLPAGDYDVCTYVQFASTTGLPPEPNAMTMGTLTITSGGSSGSGVPNPNIFGSVSISPSTVIPGSGAIINPQVVFNGWTASSTSCPTGDCYLAIIDEGQYTPGEQCPAINPATITNRCDYSSYQQATPCYLPYPTTYPSLSPFTQTICTTSGTEVCTPKGTVYTAPDWGPTQYQNGQYFYCAYWFSAGVSGNAGDWNNATGVPSNNYGQTDYFGGLGSAVLSSTLSTPQSSQAAITITPPVVAPGQQAYVTFNVGAVGSSSDTYYVEQSYDDGEPEQGVASPTQFQCLNPEFIQQLNGACTSSSSFGLCIADAFSGALSQSSSFVYTAPTDAYPANTTFCGYDVSTLLQDTQGGSNIPPQSSSNFATANLTICNPNAAVGTSGACPTEPSCQVCAAAGFYPNACYSISASGLTCEAQNGDGSCNAGYSLCATSGGGPNGAIGCLGAGCYTGLTGTLDAATQAICGIYNIINSVLFILALTIMLLGGTLYMASQFLPGQTRGSIQGYAMGMVLGGIVGVIIAVASPWILSLATNIAANTIIGYCA